MKQMILTVSLSAITLICGCKNEQETSLHADQIGKFIVKDHVFSLLHDEFSRNQTYRNVALITTSETLHLKHTSDLQHYLSDVYNVRKVQDTYNMPEINFYGTFRATNKFSGRPIDFVFIGLFDEDEDSGDIKVESIMVEWEILEPIEWDWSPDVD